MHIPSASVLVILLAPFLLWALLYVLSEFGQLPMKPLKPWLVATVWLLWGAGTIGFFADSPWRSAVWSLYAGLSLLLGWVKRRYLFESNVKPRRSLASLLTVPQTTYIEVKDVSTASGWYAEKFGLRKLTAAEQARPDGVTLQFDESTNAVILIPKDPVNYRAAPVFFTRKVEKVRERLIANGVNAGPVQKDRQGTNFFELLDGEGNTLEVSEKP
jgi:hypothetical protein